MKGSDEQHVFVVLTDAVPGTEDEYNDWYDNVHLADVTALPGFKSASRFELSSVQPEGSSQEASHKYLALYWIEGDANEAFANLAAAVEDGSVPISEALDRENAIAWNYTARTDG